MSRTVRLALVSAALAILTIAVYAGVWSFDYVQIDDPTYVVHNTNIADGLTWSSVTWAFTTGYAANWHPLTWLSHMLDVELFGRTPGPAHLVNLLLHIANVLLLFWVLARATGAIARSAVVAALFAVHPLHVESVAWVSERKDVLSALFWMLSLGAYVAYVQRPARWRYVLVAVFLALGLMAKPMLVTLPFVLLLLDVWPLGRLRGFAGAADLKVRPTTAGALVREKLPLFALSVLSSLATFLAQRGGGAVMTLDKMPLLLRIENALVSYVSYVVRAIWPAGLQMYYPPHASFPAWLVLACAVLLIVTTVGAIRWTRSRPYVGVGWLWYLGTLVPVIGLVQVGRQSMADRYTYVPLIGLFIVVVWTVGDALAQRTSRRWLAPLLTAGVIGACAVQARAQVQYWRNDQALWTHALQVTLQLDEHRASLAASDLLAENRLTELQALLETHVGSAKPAAPATARQYLGRHFLRHSQPEEAIHSFSEGIQMDPAAAEIHSDLALALARQGRIEDAIAEYREALRVNPAMAETQNDFGFLLAQQGRLAEAMPHFAEAVRLRPDLADAHRNLGLALATAGRLDDAVKEFKEVLRINPNDANVRRALEELQRRGGKPPGAGATR